MSRKKKGKIKKVFTSKVFWSLFLIIVIGASFSYVFLFSDFFIIKEARISPQGKFSSKLKKEFFSVLGNNFWLINSKKLEERILTKYPEIKSAEITKKLPSEMELFFQQRRPVGAVCFDDGCFLVDKNGVIFGKKKSSQELLLISVRHKEKVKMGEEVLEDRVMRKFLKVEEKLEKEFDTKIKRIAFANKEKVEIKTTPGYSIYFDFTKNLELDLTKLHFLLKKEISPEERKKLEYIDLRFSKAYYK